MTADKVRLYTSRLKGCLVGLSGHLFNPNATGVLHIGLRYTGRALRHWQIYSRLLQSTNQFFLFPLPWTTQYTARSTTPSAYKYSTCTYTSCPAHIIPTASPTCLQPIPHRPPSSIRCHRLLRATPRLCPATAASGKPASPTSATLRRRDVQPHPRRQFHRPLWSPPAPLTKR